MLDKRQYRGRPGGEMKAGQIFSKLKYELPTLAAGLYELKTVCQFFRPLISKHTFSELPR